jgi:hypothetical protein
MSQITITVKEGEGYRGVDGAAVGAPIQMSGYVIRTEAEMVEITRLGQGDPEHIVGYKSLDIVITNMEIAS